MLDAVAISDADREMFVEPAVGDRPRRAVTFADVARTSRAVAGWLIGNGVQRGDVVAIEMPNGIDFAIAFHAIIRAGAIATGINARLGPSEVAHIRAMAAPVITLSELPAAESLAPGSETVFPTLDGNDPLAIVWTGGTTGLPKGAWFDHACLRAMADGAAPLSEYGDRRLSPLPFSHVGFATRAWDEIVHRITTVIAPTPWTAETTLAVMADERITVAQGVPTQYRMLLDLPQFDDTDLSAVRIVGVGAARVQPELVVELSQRYGAPVVHRYASTEASVATGTRLSDPPEVICSTVGRPNGGVEMKIVDEDGIEQPSTTTGTICLRSRAMMRGYWRDPQRTAEAIDDDGWLHTGDLGWIGGDGNLRIAGRRTEMYIRGGYNVYPIEVENALGDHPAIAAAAVCGASVTDRLGEIGVLFAVPRPGASIDLAEIRAFVRGRLADYKAPDAVVVVDALPLTSIGKIDKKSLQPAADQLASTWRRGGA